MEFSLLISVEYVRFPITSLNSPSSFCCCYLSAERAGPNFGNISGQVFNILTSLLRGGIFFAV